MIDHFHFRVKSGPCLESVHTLGPVRSTEAAGVHPLQNLLEGLRDQNIALTTFGGQISGRLLTTNPVTLVGQAGEATIVPIAQIQSVEF